MVAPSVQLGRATEAPSIACAVSWPFLGNFVIAHNALGSAAGPLTLLPVSGDLHASDRAAWAAAGATGKLCVSRIGVADRATALSTGSHPKRAFSPHRTSAKGAVFGHSRVQYRKRSLQ